MIEKKGIIKMFINFKIHALLFNLSTNDLEGYTSKVKFLWLRNKDSEER